MARIGFVLLVFAALTGWASACADTGTLSADPCNTDFDCTVRERCLQGECRAFVSGDGDGDGDDGGLREPDAGSLGPVDGGLREPDSGSRRPADGGLGEPDAGSPGALDGGPLGPDANDARDGGQPDGAAVDSGFVFDAGMPPADSDNDGVIDTMDNCPMVANPMQLNRDGSGGGDACDPACADADNDNFYLAGNCFGGSAQPDCNDMDMATNPDAVEVCDFRDNDCDGEYDLGCGCDLFRDPSGRDFWMCREGLSWVDADARCVADFGARLAVLDDAALNQSVWDEATSVYGGGWFFGLREGDAEGSWAWTDGDPLTFEAWGDGEPNDSSGEDCGGYHSNSAGDARWNDWNCIDDYRPSICDASPQALCLEGQTLRPHNVTEGSPLLSGQVCGLNNGVEADGLVVGLDRLGSGNDCSDMFGTPGVGACGCAVFDFGEVLSSPLSITMRLGATDDACGLLPCGGGLCDTGQTVSALHSTTAAPGDWVALGTSGELTLTSPELNDYVVSLNSDMRYVAVCRDDWAPVRDDIVVDTVSVTCP